MTKSAASVGIGIALAIAVSGTAGAQGTGWAPVECDLNTGHYLVNSGLLYLRNAARTRFQDQRDRDLRDAHRVLSQALDQGRDDDAAVWYLLGRYHASRGELEGADSTWDKAESMAPQCTDDIRTHRRRLWVPNLNRGVDALQAGDMDDAKAAFHRANLIYQGEPPGFYYLGQIYANAQVTDSSVMFYDRAIAAASTDANRENEQYENMRVNASFNVARLFHRQQQYDSAVVWYERYRESKPGDPEAITGQASALSEAGRDAEAVALYDSVLMRADDMPTLDLFTTGVALFRAGNFERAAQAFETGLERNALYRDALFNLANTYLRMSDADSGLSDEERDAMEREYGEKMFPIAQRLVEVDPSSASALRLLAAAFQLRGIDDSTLAVLERAQALTFDITVSVFRPASGGGFEMRGIITSLADGELAVPPLTFEFLNEAGDVVETVEIPQQTIESEGMAPFQARATAEGVAAWRYSVGS